MQPYLFPYIGYFQLIHSVDAYVSYDSVQYVDRGWVNRNRIQVNGSAEWLTFPVQKASRNLPINARYYVEDRAARTRLLRKLEAAYGKAKAFWEVMPVVEELLNHQDSNVSRFNTNSLKVISEKLGLHREFVFASDLSQPEGLKGEDRVLDICRRVEADTYINPIGGTSLYDERHFKDAGVQLSFIRTDVPPKEVGDGLYQLSILDFLFERGFAATAELMTRYTLLTPADASRYQHSIEAK